MMPMLVVPLWILGLLAIGLLGAGAYLGREWYRRAWDYDPALRDYVFDPDFGLNGPTAMLVGALALLAMALAGRWIVRGIWALRGRSSTRTEVNGAAPPTTSRQLRLADGSVIHVELSGPEDAPPIVLTHGWGANSAEWNDLRRALGRRFRLIAWDLPGLGRSDRPADNDYSLERMAQHLDAVLGLAGGRPAVLLGHSIGGMIALTFCRILPHRLGNEVAGLILVHTTHTNPVRTTKHAMIYTALERPVLVPLLRLTIGLAPLVRLMSWMSYQNGSAHLSSKRDGFAGTESWDQVDFATRFLLQAPPAVLARGMLGMLRYDATETLPSIHLPTLVVPGDRDPVCLPEASERMARDIPGAQLLPLSPARHMGLLEHNRDFARHVAEFVESCRSTAGAPEPVATMPRTA